MGGGKPGQGGEGAKRPDLEAFLRSEQVGPKGGGGGPSPPAGKATALRWLGGEITRGAGRHRGELHYSGRLASPASFADFGKGNARREVVGRRRSGRDRFDWMERRKSHRRLLNIRRRASGLIRGNGRKLSREFRVSDRLRAPRLHRAARVSLVLGGFHRLGRAERRSQSIPHDVPVGNGHGACERPHGQHRAMAAD